MPNFIHICSYFIEKIPENRQKRPNLGTRPVILIIIKLFKPRSHSPGFQPRRHYGVDTGAHRDYTVATPAGTTFNRITGTPC